MKRQRRQPTPGEFVDPLQNYDAPEYADPFERDLCEHTVDEIDHKPVLSIATDATIAQAMRMLVDHDAACLTIVDADNKPVGILSERDILNKVVDDLDRMKDRPVTEVMTAKPYCVYRTDCPAQVFNLMGTGGFRHVPVLNADGKLVGLIGTRRILRWLKHYFPNVESA